ncbi:MAG: glycosyltransferase family 25 protein [Alphaproteobacteria bacterium]|nr:glycosyltransferase family 25 protein [Alphaproteobacteria bacterium]
MFNYLFNDSYNSPIEENTSFTKGAVGSYLINMDKAIERLNIVLPAIEKLGFPVQRIAAVDGRSLGDRLDFVDKETYKDYFKMYPELGTIGCSLSHEKALREFLKSENEFAIIFEDDVEFDADKLRDAVENVIYHKELWDVIGLELIHHGMPIKVAKDFVGYLTNVKDAGCYLLNRYAARQYLQKFYPIKMPFDHYYTATWEFDIKFFGIEPRIVKQRGLPSQIKISATPNKIRTLSVLIKNAWFNIKREIINFVYNIMVYTNTH